MTFCIIALLTLLLPFSDASNVRRVVTSSTSISNTSRTTTTPAVTECRSCEIYRPSPALSFSWPVDGITSEVLQTVIVQVDTVKHITSTVTKTATVAEAAGDDQVYIIWDELKFWQSLLKTNDVHIQSHTPTVTYKAQVYTKPGAFTVVTKILAYPTTYYNAMFLGATRDFTTNAALTTCDEQATSQFGLTPTAYGFDHPVSASEWDDLIPPAIQSKCTFRISLQPTSTALRAVSALTTTTTQFLSLSENQVSVPGVNNPDTKPPPAASPTAGAQVNSPSGSPNAGPTNSGSPNPGATNPGSSNSGSSNTANQPPNVAATITPPPSPSGTSSAVVISGITITPGASAVTISGTPISLASSGGTLVVGSTTYTAGLTSTSAGYGSLIWQGVGGGSEITASMATYTGDAMSSRIGIHLWCLVPIMIFVGLP